MKKNYNNLYLSIIILIFILILSYIIVYKNYEFALFLITIIISTLLLLNKPLYGIFAVFITTNIYNPSIRMSFINIYASNALIILSFIFLFLERFIRKEKLKHTSLELPLTLFTIFCFTTLRPDSMNIQAKRIMAYTIFTLSFFVSVNLINKKNLNKVLELIFFSSVSGGIYVLYTFFFVRFRGSVMRGTGSFFNPNHVGQYFILFIPLIIYYSFKKKNPIYIILSTIPILALFSSISRAAIIALFFSFVFVSTFIKRNYWYFILSIFIGTSSLFIPAVYLRFSNIINLNDHSFLARVTLWINALNQFKDNALTGVGVGKFFGSAIPYDAKIFNGTFNQFLTIMVETGIVGLLLYIWILSLLFFQLFKYYFKEKDIFYKNIALCIMISCISFQILSFAEDPLMAIITNWGFGIIIGIFYSIRSDEIENNGNCTHLCNR